MKIKKGDILYTYDWKVRSDKDYCTDGLTCKDEKGIDCINYKKCLMQPKKIVLTKVTITKKTFRNYGTSKEIRHYNAVDLKNWREPTGNFSNASHYKTKVKIYLENINKWAKSEKGAFIK